MRTFARRNVVALGLCVSLVGLFGCEKIKAAMGKGDDGGAASSGGILSFLGTDFEGEIAANIKTKSRPTAQAVTFFIKKPKYRIEIPGGADSPNPTMPGGGAVILDPTVKKGWVLVPDKKMAMELDFDKMKSMKGGLPGLPNAPKAPTTPPKIDKTGKKDTVAGYTCDIWNITSEDKRKAEVCVAEGITWIDLSDLGMGSPEVALAAVASEANHFPLRVVAYDPAGVEETRMEATKISKAKLDDAQFVVPPDYKTVDMATMLGGLGALGGGRPGQPPNMPHMPMPLPTQKPKH